MEWFDSRLIISVIIAGVAFWGIWGLYHCCSKVKDTLRILNDFKKWQEQKNRDCGCPDDITKPPPPDPDWP